MFEKEKEFIRMKNVQNNCNQINRQGEGFHIPKINYAHAEARFDENGRFIPYVFTPGTVQMSAVSANQDEFGNRIEYESQPVPMNQFYDPAAKNGNVNWYPPDQYPELYGLPSKPDGTFDQYAVQAPQYQQPYVMPYNGYNPMFQPMTTYAGYNTQFNNAAPQQIPAGDYSIPAPRNVDNSIVGGVDNDLINKVSSIMGGNTTQQQKPEFNYNYNFGNANNTNYIPNPMTGVFGQNMMNPYAQANYNVAYNPYSLFNPGTEEYANQQAILERELQKWFFYKGKDYSVYDLMDGQPHKPVVITIHDPKRGKVILVDGVRLVPGTSIPEVSASFEEARRVYLQNVLGRKPESGPKKIMRGLTDTNIPETNNDDTITYEPGFDIKSKFIPRKGDKLPINMKPRTERVKGVIKDECGLTDAIKQGLIEPMNKGKTINENKKMTENDIKKDEIYYAKKKEFYRKNGIYYYPIGDLIIDEESGKLNKEECFVYMSGRDAYEEGLNFHPEYIEKLELKDPGILKSLKDADVRDILEIELDEDKSFNKEIAPANVADLLGVSPDQYDYMMKQLENKDRPYIPKSAPKDINTFLGATNVFNSENYNTFKPDEEPVVEEKKRDSSQPALEDLGIVNNRKVIKKIDDPELEFYYMQLNAGVIPSDTPIPEPKHIRRAKREAAKNALRSEELSGKSELSKIEEEIAMCLSYNNLTYGLPAIYQNKLNGLYRRKNEIIQTQQASVYKTLAKIANRYSDNPLSEDELEKSSGMMFFTEPERHNPFSMVDPNSFVGSYMRLVKHNALGVNEYPDQQRYVNWMNEKMNEHRNAQATMSAEEFDSYQAEQTRQLELKAYDEKIRSQMLTPNALSSQQYDPQTSILNHLVNTGTVNLPEGMSMNQFGHLDVQLPDRFKNMSHPKLIDEKILERLAKEKSFEQFANNNHAYYDQPEKIQKFYSDTKGGV